jgi:hypothetical protein
MWRYGWLYLQIFSGLALAIGILGLWRGPLNGTIIAGLGLILAGNAILPLITVVGLALSAYLLGRIVFRAPGLAASDHLLVGITLFGTLLSLMVHLPINYPGTWALLFILPVVAGQRFLRGLPPLGVWSRESCWHLYAMQCAIGAILLLHLLVSLMPEIGHDALAMHLFVPAQIAYRHVWAFDTKLNVWAVMPMLVDWCYSAAYMFAGETAARLVNFGGIVLVAVMVRRVAQWMGGGPVATAWAVFLFLITPLTFTESSSLFIEALWSALVLGGTLALLRLFTEPLQGSARQILLGCVLWAGALAAKAVTFTIFPGMVLVLVFGARRWLTLAQLRALSVGLMVFIAIGLLPYVVAFALTNNPVFPFFNELFKSPLYPPTNFSSSVVFQHGVTWDTLYQMTFDSGKYLESTPGAAGFHWLLLVVPAIVGVVLSRNWRALAVVFIAAAALVLTFVQTAYLRYVFPSFGLSCAILAPALQSLSSTGVIAWRAGVLAAIMVALLNLLHFDAGTYWGNIDLRVIADARVRETYLQKKLPLRVAVEQVNALNQLEAPVAFFSAPLFAGLKGDALTNTWYNLDFATEARGTQTADEIGLVLARRNVDYVVLDDAWGNAGLRSRVGQATIEVTRVGTVSVRRLRDDYRYTRELLPATTFDPADSHGFTLNTSRVIDKGFIASADEAAYVIVPVRPGSFYRYSAEVLCADSLGAQARLQVNWLRSDGGLIYPDALIVPCSAETQKRAMDVRAPADAVKAVVSAASHTGRSVIFSSVSFRN